jgi:hypothetical protein
VAQVIVNLQVSERDALRTLARLERRDPRAQAAFIIREKLIERGLLKPDAPTSATTTVQPAEVQHADAN